MLLAQMPNSVVSTQIQDIASANMHKRNSENPDQESPNRFYHTLRLIRKIISLACQTYTQKVNTKKKKYPCVLSMPLPLLCLNSISSRGVMSKITTLLCLTLISTYSIYLRITY